MQKIQNLKNYTSTEIGIHRDATTADQEFQRILAELKKAVETLPGVTMASEEEVPF